MNVLLRGPSIISFAIQFFFRSSIGKIRRCRVNEANAEKTTKTTTTTTTSNNRKMRKNAVYTAPSHVKLVFIFHHNRRGSEGAKNEIINALPFHRNEQTNEMEKTRPMNDEENRPTNKTTTTKKILPFWGDGDGDATTMATVMPTRALSKDKYSLEFLSFRC